MPASTRLFERRGAHGPDAVGLAGDAAEPVGHPGALLVGGAVAGADPAAGWSRGVVADALPRPAEWPHADRDLGDRLHRSTTIPRRFGALSDQRRVGESHR